MLISLSELGRIGISILAVFGGLMAIGLLFGWISSLWWRRK